MAGIVKEWTEKYPTVEKMPKRIIRRRGGSPNTLQSYCYVQVQELLRRIEKIEKLAQKQKY